MDVSSTVEESGIAGGGGSVIAGGAPTYIPLTISFPSIPSIPNIPGIPGGLTEQMRRGAVQRAGGH